MTLESKLRALVARWRGATKAFSADGASRPLEWEGKDILRVCADDLEALLAERQEPPAVEQAFTDGADWKRISGSAIRKAALEEAEQIVKKWNFMACSDVEGLLHEFRTAAAAPSSGTGESK